MREHGRDDDNPQDATLAAYEAGAAEYAGATPEGRSSLASDLLNLVRSGSRVLELGVLTGDIG